MTTLTPFTYEGHSLRVVECDGEPMIVAGDLAAALGYRSAPDLTRSLDDDEKGTQMVRTPGGDQTMTVITEAGFYRACLNRQSAYVKDEGAREFVRRFQRWVTHEVLPSIRRTGGYHVDGLDALVPRTLPDALRAYAREVEAREAMEAYARELEPKADSYDRFISGDGTYSVGNVAKMLGRSQNKLFADLRNAGILIAKGAMANTPYQRYMGHFAVKAYDYTRSDGTVATSYTTRVQPSGVEFIARKLGCAIQEAVA